MGFTHQEKVSTLFSGWAKILKENFIPENIKAPTLGAFWLVNIKRIIKLTDA